MTRRQSISPRPSWSRADWLAAADRLLDAASPFGSEGFGRITFPGAEGGYGRAVDGLEGFARTFLLAAFRIAGARGEGVERLITDYRRGVIAGVDPDAADRWVRMDEHAQAKVEAASIAIALDLTRAWIWDTLDETTQQRVIAYLAPVVGDTTYPRTNWLWFRVVVETFLRSVGGPWSAEDIADDLALHDELARPGGWFSDGPERAFDHYVGWALHVYPVLWSRMDGAADLAGGRTPRDVLALDRFLADALLLVGGDGSPLIQGRSLIYRFAAAAPFWVGVIGEVPSHAPGELRSAAERIVRHFADAGAPDADGLLTLGWHGEWRDLAQSYSGTGSPYWAVKGFLGIQLPEDHPVWAAEAQPLPVDTADRIGVVGAAGWAVSATAADGIVRIANHGTDKALAGVLRADSPLYARIGYSTATAPLLDAQAWIEPLEQAVTIVNGAGATTHRTAIDPIAAYVDGAVAVASSTSVHHIVTPVPAEHRHGAGLEGASEVLGRLTVTSLLRGAWELRLITVDELAVAADTVSLQIGGWPLASDAAADIARGDDTITIAADGLVSSLSVSGATLDAVVRRDASPLGNVASTPVATLPVHTDGTTAVLVALSGDDLPTSWSAALEADGAHVVWPDGHRTVTRLPHSDPNSGSAHPGPLRGRHAITTEEYSA